MSCSALLPTPDLTPARHPIATGSTNLRDTLLALPSEEDSPSNSAGVLALEEERLGLSALEAEDLAVRADEELAL